MQLKTIVIASVLAMAPITVFASTEKKDTNANANADYGSPAAAPAASPAASPSPPACPKIEVVTDDYSPYCDEVVPKACLNDIGYGNGGGGSNGNNTRGNGTINNGTIDNSKPNDDDGYRGQSEKSGAATVMAFGSTAVVGALFALVM